MMQLLDGWLRHKSEMVNFEAAKAICDMRDVTEGELVQAVQQNLQRRIEVDGNRHARAYVSSTLRRTSVGHARRLPHSAMGHGHGAGPTNSGPRGSSGIRTAGRSRGLHDARPTSLSRRTPSGDGAAGVAAR